MHPVLFKIPGLDWPVRMFGLYVIDAFFVATLWVQWRYAMRKDEGFAAEAGLAKSFKLLLFGIVISRILWIAVPGLDWSWRVIGVLAVDFLLSAITWMNLVQALKRNETAAKEADFVFNLGFWLLLVGFMGARLFWILTTPGGRERFASAPIDALFFVWDGGIVFYGGLVCGSVFGLWYLWYKNRNVMELLDILITGMALTLLIGRWSCLSAGDDYGSPTNMPWGIVFPVDANSQIPRQYQGTTALHPSELYMSLNGLVLFLLTLPVLLRKKWDGQVFFLGLMLYSMGRSTVELFRGDATRGLYDIGGVTLSSSQIISIPVFILAAFFFLRGWRRYRRKKSASDVSPEAAAS